MNELTRAIHHAQNMADELESMAAESHGSVQAARLKDAEAVRALIAAARAETTPVGEAVAWRVSWHTSDGYLTKHLHGEKAGAREQFDTIAGMGLPVTMEPLYASPSSPGSEGGQWRDISTAPRDGTEINGYRPDQGVFTFRRARMEEFVPKDQNGDPTEDYDEDFEDWWHDRWGWMEGDLCPTHWMPLPLAPYAQSVCLDGGE